MLIDGTTLADLQVFSSQDGRNGVLGLLDHTSTELGRRALRRRIAAPPDDIAEIRSVQDSVEFLLGLERPIWLDDRVISGVASYLTSPIVVSRASGVAVWIEEAWLRVRYRDVVGELRDGLAAVRALCTLVRTVLPALASGTAPPVLQALGERLSRSVELLAGALDARPLIRADRRVRQSSRETIPDALDALAELDALQSLAIAGRRPGWSRPEIVESEEFLLEAEDAFHPFVPDAIPNPIVLGGGEPLVFLTGPNMAGKTTYLRTVGLIALLAQVGSRVPARVARLSPVEALLTSLNPTDNLRAGVSYFYAEVLRVREAATHLAEGRRALVLFDEVFKGTNVKDALDASSEVIEGFARSRRSGSIFSSHLSELADTLGNNPSIRLCRFDGHVAEGRPSFTFRLEPGVSEKRFGMLLLRQAEVPQLIARIQA